VVASTGLLASGRLANPQARALAAAAPAFGIWLALRRSPWLLPLDLLSTAVLLVSAASLARGGSVLDIPIPNLVARASLGIVHGLAGPGFLARPVLGRARLAVRARPGRVRQVLGGLALAVPLVALLGGLLASADAVFARLVLLRVDPDSLGIHVVGLMIGAWAASGLLRISSVTPPPRRAARTPLGPVEATVILGGLVALFGMFGVSQLVAVTEGGRRVIETAGLTYAQYARSGFFQLLAVAALTLTTLLALRELTHLPGSAWRARFSVLSVAAVVMTLLIVVVALRRLDLYERVFGLTMLRLYVTASAMWIGALFVLLGLRLAGVGGRYEWFPSAGVAAALAVLLVLNAINPEAVVIRHNVGRAERTGRFDAAYLASLSEDAVPTLVELVPALGPADRAAVMARLCPAEGSAFTGWAAWNLSDHRARRALAGACPGGRPGGAAQPSTSTVRAGPPSQSTTRRGRQMIR
jgi:Domain of unknown function (DUF4173)